ncbi:MAG: TolC family protein [Opitutaceae bacterium]
MRPLCAATFAGLALPLLGCFSGGCAHFNPQPISPGATAQTFDARSLADPGLQVFLRANHAFRGDSPGTWNLRALTWVAFYYQPDLEEARMRWKVAHAGQITAGARPNPSITLQPAYDNQIPGATPWVWTPSLDIPIETAGKRGYRLAEARASAEAANWSLVEAVWRARANVRDAMLNLESADRGQALLGRQEQTQARIVRLLQGQLKAGNVSSYVVTQAEVAFETAQIALQGAQRQAADSRTQLAAALGLPRRALKGIPIAFPALERIPEGLIGTEARHQALHDRPDVRGALARYAAKQAALQLEIAKQYPDIHLGPGYSWNSGSVSDNMWQLGVTLTLPILNRNQGPIAEARAARAQAAAQFLATQATAINEVDGALAGYDSARQEAATAAALRKHLRRSFDSVLAMQRAGEADALAVANAEIQYDTSALAELKALVRVRRALNALEDATESPIVLSESAVARAERTPTPPFPSHEP